MKFEIQRSDKKIELLKQLASRDVIKAQEAKEAIAAFIGPVIQEVINVAPTLSNIYARLPFEEDSNPSIPLDVYLNVTEEDYIQVWSQAEPGGLPFNQPTPPTQELKFSTYRLDSAVAFQRKYAQQSRLDVLAKAMERLMQEVLIKQDTNAAAVVLRALALASTTVNGIATKHIIRSQNPNTLILHDFNRLFTLMKRLHSAWNGGTPEAGRGRGITDLLVSPEMVESLRAMAYNPINTRGGVVTRNTGSGTTATQSESAVALTEQMRQEIFNNAGIPEFFGVNIMEIYELGVGYKYNDLFDGFAGSTSYANHPGTSTGTTFDGTAEEIVIGIDMSTDSLIRPVATDAETSAEFNVMPDDQFVQRSGKIGFYGALEEGRIILDDRAICGLIV